MHFQRFTKPGFGALCALFLSLLAGTRPSQAAQEAKNDTHILNGMLAYIYQWYQWGGGTAEIRDPGGKLLYAAWSQNVTPKENPTLQFADVTGPIRYIKATSHLGTTKTIDPGNKVHTAAITPYANGRAQAGLEKEIVSWTGDAGNAFHLRKDVEHARQIARNLLGKYPALKWVKVAFAPFGDEQEESLLAEAHNGSVTVRYQDQVHVSSAHDRGPSGFNRTMRARAEEKKEADLETAKNNLLINYKANLTTGGEKYLFLTEKDRSTPPSRTDRIFNKLVNRGARK